MRMLRRLEDNPKAASPIAVTWSGMTKLRSIEQFQKLKLAIEPTDCGIEILVRLELLAKRYEAMLVNLFGSCTDCSEAHDLKLECAIEVIESGRVMDGNAEQPLKALR